MNELCNIFSAVQNEQTVVLAQGKTYHVYPEDSVHLTGYYCTNTAKKDENPNGERDTPMYLCNKKNITIDGNGATVLIHGKMTPFVFDRCENITVRNLTVDYAVPTMTEFTVLSNCDGVCEIAVNPVCLYRVDGNDLYWCGETAKNGAPYWENRCNAPKRYVKVYDPVAQCCRDFRREDLTFSDIEQIAPHVLRVTLQDKNADFVPGHIFQTRNIIRDQSGSLFQRCKNLYFENLRICFMHGLGMVSQFCENITFYNCDFSPAEGRTIASTADFFQFSGCKGNITVDSCKAHGAQDDYINAHGTHLQIVEADEANNSLTVRFMHAETWGLQAFEAEDEIAFIRWDTLIPYAENTVTAYERLNDTDILLHLAKPLPDGIIIGKDAVENVTWSPSLYVRNCDFGVTAGRGILCTVRGEVIIENNRFYHLWGPALLVEDDCNFWFESGLTNHVTFRNNTVIGCNYNINYPDGAVICYSPKVMKPDSTAPVHGKLTLTGNHFSQAYTGKHTFCLPYLRETEIADNTSDAPMVVIK